MKTITRPNKATEAALITLAQRGNREALSRLIKVHHAFVYQIAIKYWCLNKYGHFTVEDYVQYGCQGLQKGILKFDVTRGLKLISYASWWIRQCISKAIQEQSNLIRIPSGFNSRPRGYANPNVGAVSLDHENCPFEPTIEDEDPLDMMGARQEVAQFLTVLSTIERDATKRRFGIGREPQTLQEIGDDYGLSRERIRQITDNAMRKMQRAAKRRG